MTTVNESVSVPRGCPKSGRFWKSQKSRFCTVKKSPGLSTTFEGKQKLREELKRIKDISRSRMQEINAEKEARKERRRENIKRKEANLLKSEIVQVVKDTAKIKRMKKKQLKHIKKRDTLNMK